MDRVLKEERVYLAKIIKAIAQTGANVVVSVCVVCMCAYNTTFMCSCHIALRAVVAKVDSARRDVGDCTQLLGQVQDHGACEMCNVCMYVCVCR
jgi:hypothetical protein